MIKAAKEVMKIIWNGFVDTRRNVNHYFSRKTKEEYASLLSSVKGKEWTQEALEERFYMCGREIHNAERKITADSIFFILAGFVTFGRYGDRMEGEWLLLCAIIAFIIYLAVIFRLFRKRSVMAAERDILQMINRKHK
ncbi:hypothetical protein AALB39_22425 [Lachnospiraceae bacterium 54-53]